MIEFIDIHKRFGNKVVLDGVTTNIEPAKTTVFIGPSGCGKSTTLRVLLRLLEPEKGLIKYYGENILDFNQKDLDNYRKKTAIVFQSAALFDSLKIWENIGFALLERDKRNREEVREIAKQKLEIVGLAGSEDLYPSELSGGMQKRAAIARAIVQEPELILYDEPTTGLDPITSTVIENLMKELQVKQKITSIIVTHQHSTIFRNADIITFFQKGKVYASGSPEEIKGTKDKLVKDFIEGNV